MGVAGLERTGRWHGAEVTDPARKGFPSTTARSSHAFADRLAAETGKADYELERRLGHSFQRYIQRYTNPSEEVAAGHAEEF